MILMLPKNSIMKFDNNILEYDDVMSRHPSKQLDFLEDHDY